MVSVYLGRAGATNALLVDDTDMCNNVRLRNDIFYVSDFHGMKLFRKFSKVLILDP